MQDFGARIKIQVVGARDVQELEGRISRLGKAVEQTSFKIEGETKKLRPSVVSINRVTDALQRSQRILNRVNVDNNFAQLRGAVKLYVTALENQVSVQRKINKEIEREIALRNAQKAAIMANIAASRAAREASGFNEPRDATAGSIRRAQERRAQIERARFLDARAAGQTLTGIGPLALPAFQSRAGVRDLTNQPSAAVRALKVGYEDASAAARRLREEAERAEQVESRRAIKLRELARYYEQQAVLAGSGATAPFLSDAQRAAIRANVAASAASRSASNFGFGLAGDPVAKSIERNREKVARQALRLEQQSAQLAEDLADVRRRRVNTERRAALVAENDLQRQRLVGGRTFDERLQAVQQRRSGGSTGGGAFARRARQSVSDAVIGGAFPALFGQGGGASLGGALGGFAGGLVGGPGGFAGSLVGTVIGSQLDSLTQALEDPAQAADLLARTTSKLNAEQIRRIDQLLEEGRAIDAQRVVFDQLLRTLGKDGLRKTIEAGSAIESLGKTFGDLSTAIVTESAPAIERLASALDDLTPAASKAVAAVAQVFAFSLEGYSKLGNGFDAEARRRAQQRFEAEGIDGFALPGSARAQRRQQILAEERASALTGGERLGPPVPPRLGEAAMAKDAEQRRKLEEQEAKKRRQEAERLAREAAQAQRRAAEEQLRLQRQIYDNRIRLETAAFDARMRLMQQERELAERLLQKKTELFGLEAPAGAGRDQAQLIGELLANLRGFGNEISSLTDQVESANLRVAQLAATPPAMQVNPAAFGQGVGGSGFSGGARTGWTRDPDAEQSGYDVVLPGGRGAGIPSPVDLTITGRGFQGSGAGSSGRGYGNWVSGTFTGLDGRKYELLLGHLDQINVNPGDVVGKGGILGTQGITGRTFGTHVTTHVNALQGGDPWSVLKNQVVQPWVSGWSGGSMGGPAPGAQAIPTQPFVPDPVGQLAQQGSLEGARTQAAGYAMQLQKLVELYPQLKDNEVLVYLQKTANSFRDQAQALKESTQEQQLRTRLTLEGFNPSQIEEQVGFRGIDRDVNARLAQFDSNIFEELTRAAPELAAELRQLTKTAIDLEAAESKKVISANRFATEDATAAQDISGLRSAGIGLQGQLEALREGRTELTEAEQLMVRIRQAGGSIVELRYQEAFAQAAVNDALQEAIDKQQTALQYGQQMADIISGGIQNGIEGLIRGTRTLEEALADVLSQLGSLFISAALNSVFGAGGPLGGGFFSGLFGGGRASGGSVDGRKSYLVGEEGPELFIPGVSGTIIPADETAEAAAAAYGMLADGGEASDETSATVAAMGGGGASSRFSRELRETSSSTADTLSRELRETNVATMSAISNMTEAQLERERQNTMVMAASAGNTSITYNGPILRFNDTDYVRKDDVPKIVSQSTRRSKDLVARAQKNEPAFRRAMR